MILLNVRWQSEAVVLQFQIKILRPDRLFEPINRVARPGQLVFDDQLRNLARQAAGEQNQTLLVRRQDLLVHAGLVIITLQMSCRRQPDQIAVAGFIPGQRAQMMIDIPAAAAGFFFQAAARGHVMSQPMIGLIPFSRAAL